MAEAVVSNKIAKSGGRLWLRVAVAGMQLVAATAEKNDMCGRKENAATTVRKQRRKVKHRPSFNRASTRIEETFTWITLVLLL